MSSDEDDDRHMSDNDDFDKDGSEADGSDRDERSNDRDRDKDQDDGDNENPIASMRKKKKKDKKKDKKSSSSSRRNVIADDDGDEDGEGGRGADSGDEGRKSKKRKSRIEESDSEEDDSSEEDSDEEMTEADKQFIVDDEDEEEGGDEEERERERRRKKRKKKEKEREELDEDDLDLIDENFGRPKKDKSKRLRKFGEADEEEEVDRSSRRRGDLENIFDEEEETLEPEPRASSSSRRPEYDDIEEDDDLDDFIIDDVDEEGGREEETDADREERRRARIEQRRAARINIGQNYGVSDEAWHEIQDLFGDGSDYAYAMKSRDDSTMDLDAQDEDVATPRKKATKMTDIYEPSELVEKMMTPEDEVIRSRDIPERFQLRGEMPTLTEEEIRKESIYLVRRLVDRELQILESLDEHAAKEQKKSQSGRETDSQVYDKLLSDIAYHKEKVRKFKDKEALQEVIFQVLKFFHADNYFEVPFLLAHRRDYFDKFLDRLDLWRLWDYDRLYHAVETKRANVISLLTDLRRESPEVILDRYPDQNLEIAKSMEEIQDNLEIAKSMEEIQDVLAYLQLYYNSDLQRVEEARRRVVKRSIRRTPYEDSRRAGIGGFAKLYGIDAKRFVENLLSHATDYVPEDVNEIPLEAAQRFVVEKSPFNTPEKVIEAARRMIAEEIAADPKFRAFIRKIYESDAVVTVTPTEKGRREIQPLHPYYPFKYLTEKPTFKFDDAQFLQIQAAETEGLVIVSIRVDQQDRLMQDIIRNISNDYTNEYAEKWNEERRKVAEIATTEKIFPQMARWLKEKMAADASERLSEQIRMNLENVRVKIDVAPYRRDKGANDDDWDEDDSQRDHSRVMAVSWGDGDRNSATLVVCLKEDGTVDCRMKLSYMQDREKKHEDLNRLLVRIREFRPDVIVVSGWTLATKRLLDDVAGLRDRINDNDDLGGYSRRDKGGNIPIPGITVVDDDVAKLAMNSKSYMQEFPDPYPPLARYCVAIARKVQDTTMEYARLFNQNDDIKQLRLHPLQKLAVHDVLDDTRVHPEDYALARKMAADVLEVDDVMENEDLSQFVADLMENEPERLNALMLDDFADELERTTHDKKRLTLNEIKDEMIAPYRDRRRRFSSSTFPEIFTMFTNETEESLRIGTVVSCTVTKLMDRYARVKLSNNMEGMLHLSCVPGNANSVASVYRENQMIQAAIKSIDYEKCQVEVDARPESTNRDWMQILGKKLRDERFSEEREREDRENEKRPMLKPNKPKQARVVNHPFWKSVSYQEAEQALSGQSVRRGTVIIRPSTKGNNHLSMTWKIDEGVYQHLDIQESKKENEWSLGKLLSIDGKNYDDLDEIIATYIEPLSYNFNEAMNHQKFRKATLNEMFRYVENQASTLKRSSYGVILCPDKPGRFILATDLVMKRLK
ncbi:Transcription elongation factor SPT6 [Blyttiomyces sp. JEL0837]|nr:Transcription elongation factor SPT6 [Blyttiomyces sp. JEL0837]